MQARNDIQSASTQRAADTGEYLIVLAGSAGALDGIRTILAALPTDLPAAVAVVLHRTDKPPLLLDRVLGRSTRLRVKGIDTGEKLRPGTVYVVPPNLHMTVDPGHHAGLRNGVRVRGARSSANPLLETAAPVYGPRLIVAVLSGGNGDATDGVQEARKYGGVVIAQDPATAQVSGMPSSAIGTGAVNAVLPVESIAPEILRVIAGDRFHGALATGEPDAG